MSTTRTVVYIVLLTGSLLWITCRVATGTFLSALRRKR